MQHAVKNLINKHKMGISQICTMCYNPATPLNSSQFTKYLLCSFILPKGKKIEGENLNF